MSGRAEFNSPLKKPKYPVATPTPGSTSSTSSTTANAAQSGSNSTAPEAVKPRLVKQSTGREQVSGAPSPIRARSSSQPLLLVKTSSAGDPVEHALQLACAQPPVCGLDPARMRKVDTMVSETARAWAYELITPVEKIPKHTLFRLNSTAEPLFIREQYQSFLRDAVGRARIAAASTSLLANLDRDKVEVKDLRDACQAALDADTGSKALGTSSRKPQSGSHTSAKVFADDQQLVSFQPFQEKMSKPGKAFSHLYAFLSQDTAEDAPGLPPIVVAYLVRLDAFLLHYYADDLSKPEAGKTRHQSLISMLGIHGLTFAFQEEIAGIGFGKENHRLAYKMVSYAFNKSEPLFELVDGILALNADLATELRMQARQARLSVRPALSTSRKPEAPKAREMKDRSKFSKLIARSGVEELLPSAFSKALKDAATIMIDRGRKVDHDSVSEQLVQCLDAYAGHLGSDPVLGRFARHLAWLVKRPFPRYDPIEECAMAAEKMAGNLALAEALLGDDASKDGRVQSNSLLGKVATAPECLEKLLAKAEMEALVKKLQAALQ